MIIELNDYLTTSCSFEKRGVILDAARTLESVLGPNVYVPIDELIYSQEAEDRNVTVDSICEALLAQFEVVYSKFGVFFDEDVIGVEHLTTLASGIEALLAVELNEGTETIINIINSSDDSQEVFFELLEEVSPGSGLPFEELIGRVEPTFVEAVLASARRPQPQDNISVPDEISTAYIERCMAFRKRFGRTAIVGDLIEHRANLNVDPMVSFTLISHLLDAEKSEETAKELYALVTYSSARNDEIVPKVKQLIDVVAVDELYSVKINEAFHDLLGGQNA